MSFEKDVLIWNQKGLIPGPEEMEREYLKRVDYSLALKEKLQEGLIDDLPFEKQHVASLQFFGDSFERTKTWYDIAPDWVPIFLSDYKLSVWHGGCAWIFQMKKEIDSSVKAQVSPDLKNEAGPKSAFLQLRKSFRNNKKYLKLYCREEVITHEMAHVGRLAFNEPKFEEFLAYRSSSSPFRRLCGPLVQSPYESILFVMTLLFTIIIEISLLAVGSFSSFAEWVKLIPFTLIFAAFARLWMRHRQLNRCFDQLRQIAPSKNAANAILYRLTDQEIIDYSKMSIAEIKVHIESQKEKSLRWKVIATAYLLPCKLS